MNAADSRVFRREHYWDAARRATIAYKKSSWPVEADFSTKFKINSYKRLGSRISDGTFNYDGRG